MVLRGHFREGLEPQTILLDMLCILRPRNSLKTHFRMDFLGLLHNLLPATP